MCEISFLSEVRLINSSRVIVQHFNAPHCYNPFKQGFLLDVWVRDCSLSQTFTRRDSDDGRYRNQGLWNFIEIHPWFILLFISFWRYIQWLEEKNYCFNKSRTWSLENHGIKTTPRTVKYWLCLIMKPTEPVIYTRSNLNHGLNQSLGLRLS